MLAGRQATTRRQRVTLAAVAAALAVAVALAVFALVQRGQAIERAQVAWEAATGREVAELLGHSDALVSAAFASDGRHVLTASKDGAARVHDCGACVPLGRLVRMVHDHVSAGRRLTAAERRDLLHEGA